MRIARPFIIALLCSCQSGATVDDVTPETDDPIEEPAEVGIPIVSAPRRLPAAMDLTHFAFSADGDQFKTRYVTHDVSVRAGAFTITPTHIPASRVPMHGSPLTVETRNVVRGDQVLANGVPTSRIDATTGALLVARRDVVEELASSEDGLEQSWKFDREPGTSGDLTVTIDVTGQSFVGQTSKGLHFATPNQPEKLGFRYSNATWIDANGVSTDIPVRWDGGRIAIVVPNDVLENSAYPAVLDPTVTGEVTTDDPVSGWSGVAGVRSSIASSGTGFLAVWTDSRNATTDIFGVRLDANGAPLDNFGIAIATTAANEDNATVTFANGQYVVAWDDGTNVVSSRINPATGAVTAIGTVGAGTQPALASRGATALVAFTSGADIRSALFSANTFAPSVAVTTGVTATTPTVASNPTGDFFVAWSQGTTAQDLMGRLVSSANVPGTAVTVSAGAGAQNEPAAAFNGTDFVVLWSNDNQDVFGTRVTTAGAVLDTHAEAAVTVGGKVIAQQTNRQLQAAIACVTGSCLASWSDRRTLATTGNDVFGARFDATLTQVGAEIAIAGIADEQRVPAIAAQGTDFRLVWEDRRDGAGDAIYTARVNADGSTPQGTGANIVRGNNRQVRPTTLSSTANYFVAWSDSRALANDIMGTRIKLGGARLDAAGIAVSNAARLQNNPRGAFDGTNYLVTWHDNRSGGSGNEDIFARRVSTAGALLGEFTVSAAAGDQLTPSVATGGGVSLVVWQDGRTAGTIDLFGALVVNGAVTVADIPICNTAALGNQRFPVVSFDASNNVFVVAWQDDRSGVNEVFATRVSTAGAVLGACGALISSTGSAPAITSGGGRSLITWTDRRTSPSSIFGARVTTSGNALTNQDAAGIQIATTVGVQTGESTVAFVGGSQYVVAWAEGGNIRGQTLASSTGAKLGAAFDISAAAEDEVRPAIVASADGQSAFIAYEKHVTSLNTQRVATRRITFTGFNGQSCSTSAQCATGFCVDNFCCDTACGGGSLTDCQACSATKGGTTNGICEIIVQANFTCRNYSGDGFCDVQEKCDGVNPTCPDDVGRREGQTCTVAGGGAGICPPNGVNGPSPGSPHICQ